MTETTPAVRPTVALVFGGASSEHEISCLTAAGVARAIDHERYRVLGIGITPQGRWVRVPLDEVMAFEIGPEDRLPRLSEDRPEAVLTRTADRVLVATRDGDRLLEPDQLDVAFALLHGPFGEDGTVQGLFEMFGLRYVGSGVAASSASMDKHLMKLLLHAQAIPVGPFVPVADLDWRHDRAACLDAVASLEFPVYVKPARGGSSVGITRVERLEDVAAAIEVAREHDPKVLVEQGFTEAREIECGVLGGLGGEPAQASPVAEIKVHTADKFYDFETKYLPGGKVSIDLPADLDRDVAEEVQRLAVRTFEAMGCEGLARIDFFISRTGKVFVNELNTMPGFTQTSMYPQVWQAAGLDYPRLIDRLLQLALRRNLGLR